ncbi:amidohydrolase family protein [Sphingobium sufflavum]|uniref:amidohydrolase family protein n=1 Tax=Sphingobium sufflavum TaxID=1129547 RepID=UPI001F34FA82|nr:amidohydrolase family protein [Sphingobium sufflavum]MCE7796870.1 amidohydrolase family protein [Sphingobium sufflavum]
MLIRNADIHGRGIADLRIAGDRIAAIGTLPARADEPVLEARGGALLPGLHDHHIHLAALAARRDSIPCGPPDVTDAAMLADRLAIPGTGWIRGIGYHESVAGMLDRARLDRMVPGRPVRIQHRSGRMWFFNSAGLEIILSAADAPPGLDRATGRLFDEDRWLRAALGGTPPDFAGVSAALAAFGITGITDMSPANDPAMAAHFAAQQASGHLRQRVHLAGTLSLVEAAATDRLTIGPAKLHLHEADLPDYDAAVAFIVAAHAQGRGVAIHCVSETELVFALAALSEAGPRPGDRIEHASIAPDTAMAEMAHMGLAVVSQPHFIAERGDQYREMVEPQSVPHLYRLRAFRDAGVTLAGGSDAPFGEPDPWTAMHAAVSRRTRNGHAIGPDEALSPEQALALFLADPADLTRQRAVAVDAAADLCLLDRPWEEARTRLSARDVRATILGGIILNDRVDQAP